MKLKFRLAPLAFVAFAAFAKAQDPVVPNQVRISTDNASLSADETSGYATADGLEFIGGCNDYRSLQNTQVRSSFGVTSDGGQTWAHLIVRPPAANQAAIEGDPMVCYDARTNTLFAGAMSFAGNGGIYVAKKNAGQNSFGTSVMARVSGGVDKGWMTVGPLPGNPNSSRLYIAYNEGVIWSDNQGQTWTAPKSMGSGIGFLPKLGPNGEVYLTWWNLQQGGFGVMFRRSLDGGNTWGNIQQVATRMDQWSIGNGRIPGQFRNPQFNALAVNPVNGTLVIVYFDTTNTVNGQKNLDLYMIRSTNQGTTWTAPVRLPHRPLNTVGDMIFPWIEYTREGRLNIMTYDSSYTANQTDGIAHGLWDAAYIYSDDDGATWSNKFRLTPSPFDSFNDGTGFSFLGDYLGMGYSDHYSWPVYPDTRTGQAEIYINKIYNPIYVPDVVSLFRGLLVGGDVKSLYLHDANSFVAKPGLVLNNAEAPVQVDTATSGILNNNPSQLKVALWSAVSSVNIQQQTFVFNINTQAYDLVDTRPATLTESNAVIDVPNPVNYITPATGTARVRVAFKAVGPVSNQAWTASLNQDVLLVYP